MGLVRSGNHHQPNRLDRKQFLNTAHNSCIWKCPGGLVAAALHNRGQPQAGNRANHRRMKIFSGQVQNQLVRHQSSGEFLSLPHAKRLQCTTDESRDAHDSRCEQVGARREGVISSFSWREFPRHNVVPTLGLYFGLIITILAVLAYATYITMQFSGIRKLQSEMVDRNRKDSLQLLRIQNDLNSIGLAMRDMLDAGEPYPLAAWSAQFDRIRNDLDVALKQEETLAEAARTSDQRRYLSQSLAQFWDATRPHVRPCQNGDGAGRARADSQHAATPPGSLELRRFPFAGAEQ